MATTTASLFDRTWASLVQRFRDVRRTDGDLSDLRPDLADGDIERLRAQMNACLERRGGDVSARGRATALGRAFLSLDKVGRRRFLELMATEYDTDTVAVDAAITAYSAARTGKERYAAREHLRAVLEPPRVQLLTQFNGLPEGVKFLVDLRAELMGLMRETPRLAGLEGDLKRLLASWFDVGFLELRRITWESPAALLEKLIEYEAVHEIRGWEDLKNRLDSDRRCYAFFHPRMPNEPLIFVEIALVSGIAADVGVLLDERSPVGDPANADSAIFYSISNAQRGLAGISFGNFLIKRVVDALAREFPNLKKFATLSPIPGFRRWLDGQIAERGDELLNEGERRALAELELPGEAPLLQRALDSADWHADDAATAALKAPLTRLSARYLLDAKARDGRAQDPVAHFHLSNGARVERLNWLGDRSGKGVAQSAGLMVNYLYKLDAIDANHEAYTGERRVTASSAVRSLVKG